MARVWQLLAIPLERFACGRSQVGASFVGSGVLTRWLVSPLTANCCWQAGPWRIIRLLSGTSILGRNVLSPPNPSMAELSVLWPSRRMASGLRLESRLVWHRCGTQTLANRCWPWRVILAVLKRSLSPRMGSYSLPGGMTGVVRLFNSATGQQLRPPDGHQAMVSASCTHARR